MIADKTDKEETTTEEAEVPVQDARRWVQIVAGPRSWHLIDEESLGDPGMVTTICGITTNAQTFLDRLPGGDEDLELIDEACAKKMGIDQPKVVTEEDEEEPAPKKTATKK